MNTQTGKLKIKQYMRSCWQEHIDSTCNVLNITALAEDAANHFNLYIPETEFEVSQDIYDYAVEIDTELFKRGLVNE